MIKYKSIDPPYCMSRPLGSVSLGCIWSLVLVLVAHVSGGCGPLHSITADDPGARPTGVDSLFLPLGCEERMLASLDVTGIVEIHDLAYCKKNYGQLLGVVATFEWRSGPERWYHQNYVLILGPDMTDWRQAALYQISGPPDVDHPTFFQMFDMPQEELMKWLKEIPFP